jgi:pyruvate,orthophosphate dikinase
LIGNNYVSCSPFRVPIARLAAAHAALKHRPAKKAAPKKKSVVKKIIKKVGKARTARTAKK